MGFLKAKKRRAATIIFVASMLFSIISAPIPADMTAEASSPPDIEGHWAQENIQSWIDRDLAAGYPDGTFQPDEEVTRAEFVTFMNRAFDIAETETPRSPGFKDVHKEDWHHDNVAAAVQEGLLTGYPDGTFRPERSITREEAAAIIDRLLEPEYTGENGNDSDNESNSGSNSDSNSDSNSGSGNESANPAENDALLLDRFTDAEDISQWAEKSVSAVDAAGIMSGYPDGTFRPGYPITRAETVSSLDRAMEFAAHPKPPVRFEVVPEELTMEVGEELYIQVYVTDPLDNFTITYESTAENIATVHEDGLVTAVAKGEASIEVTVSAAGYRPATETVAVSVQDEPEEVEKHIITFHEINKLENVEITLYSDENFEEQVGDPVTTDEEGNAIKELPDGDYWFTAIRWQYPDYQGNFTVEGEAKVVEFGEELGSISGEVALFNQEGNPNSAIELEILLRARDSDYLDRTYRISLYTNADDGTHTYGYIIENVVPGTYNVRANATGHLPDKVENLPVGTGEKVENINLELRASFEARQSEQTWQGIPLKADFENFTGADGEYDIQVQCDTIIPESFTVEDVFFTDGQAHEVVILDGDETLIKAHHPLITFTIDGVESYNEFVIAQQISDQSYMIGGSGTYSDEREKITFEVEALDLVGDRITYQYVEIGRLYIDNKNVTGQTSIEWNDDIWKVTVTEQEEEPAARVKFELSLVYTWTDTVVELEPAMWEELEGV